MEEGKKEGAKEAKDIPDHYLVKWRSWKPWAEVVEKLKVKKVADLPTSAQGEKPGEKEGKTKEKDTVPDSAVLTWGSLKPVIALLEQLESPEQAKDPMVISGGKGQKAAGKEEKRDPQSIPDKHWVKWGSLKPVLDVIERLEV